MGIRREDQVHRKLDCGEQDYAGRALEHRLRHSARGEASGSERVCIDHIITPYIIHRVSWRGNLVCLMCVVDSVY